MREIKFKVWDKRLKCWNYSVLNFEPFNADGKIDLNDNFMVCQFTGLHDKNGKEIYEGDIVRFDDGSKQTVFFHQGCFYACDRLQSINDIVEVIGNSLPYWMERYKEAIQYISDLEWLWEQDGYCRCPRCRVAMGMDHKPDCAFLKFKEGIDK